ncbi:TonB-dependent receptor [Phenylobacterium sp.]|uniref:TonB-dependent receptor domain-containing protein n=1 Tax=Phenylobacterium sp. TaxID=1871053 RepID=UPI0025E6FEBA|nr:TonB-dependent receptor [Phenylobacterium sp.]
MGRVLHVCAPLFVFASSAVAAPAEKPPAKSEPGKTVQEVTVTGPSRDGLRVETDRRSYGITGDLQATTGSIGDALRNVPSVSVDVQGNISLRGDSNVTIMVDGKPSGQFRGEGRAAALQNLPADQFERVEVITTPSAEFRPDGAGIINLISKKVRKPGYSGTARATYGSEGRYTAGLSGGYNSGKLSFSGDASVRHDPQKFRFKETREGLDPSSGPARLVDRAGTRGQGHIFSGRAAVDYDLDERTRLSGELRATQMRIRNTNYEQEIGDGATGATTRLLDRTQNVAFTRTNRSANASARRKFADDGELTVSLRLDRTDFDNRNRGTQVTRLPTPDAFYEDTRLDNRQDEQELKADYVRPFASGAKLKFGLELGLQDYRADFLGLRGPDSGSAVPRPGFSNRFRYEFASPGGYVTYERPFGDLTVLAGLRLQSVDIDLKQLSTGERFGQDRLNAYPSLHLAYKLSETQQVTFAYSRRIQRSNPDDLNPFRIYIDASNLRQGNPDLKPLKTDSFETAWQLRKGSTYYLATLFYRDSRDVPTDVFTDLGGGVLLRSRANIGERRSGGLELVANGKVTPKLSYNVSGSAIWNRIDAGNLGFFGGRSDVAFSGRGNLSWQATAKDFLQASGNAYGEQLTAQGRIKAYGFLNLGYRHKFNDDLSLVVTAQDVLKSAPYVVTVDTPALRLRRRNEGNMQAVFVGLTWGFGGKAKRRDPGFDFGGPPGN